MGYIAHKNKINVSVTDTLKKQSQPGLSSAVTKKSQTLSLAKTKIAPVFYDGKNSKTLLKSNKTSPSRRVHTAEFLAQREKFVSFVQRRKIALALLRREARQMEKLRSLRRHLVGVQLAVRKKSLLMKNRFRRRVTQTVRINRITNDRRALKQLWTVRKKALRRIIPSSNNLVKIVKPRGYYKRKKRARRLSCKLKVSLLKHSPVSTKTQKFSASFVKNTMLTRLPTQAPTLFSAPFRAYHTKGKQRGTRNKQSFLNRRPASKRFASKKTARGQMLGKKKYKDVKTKKKGAYAIKIATFSRRYRVRDMLARRSQSKRHLLSPSQRISPRKQGFLRSYQIAGKVLASFGCRKSRKPAYRTKVLLQVSSNKKEKPLAKQRKTSKRWFRKVRNCLKYGNPYPSKRWTFWKMFFSVQNMRTKLTGLRRANSVTLNTLHTTRRSNHSVTTGALMSLHVRAHTLRSCVDKVKRRTRYFVAAQTRKRRARRVRRYNQQAARYRGRARRVLRRLAQRTSFRAPSYYSAHRARRSLRSALGSTPRCLVLFNTGTKQLSLRTHPLSKVVSAPGCRSKLYNQRKLFKNLRAARKTIAHSAQNSFRKLSRLNLAAQQRLQRHTAKKIALTSRGALDWKAFLPTTTKKVNRETAAYAVKGTEFLPLRRNNKVYKRIYARRRARATVGRLQRLKLRRTASQKRPAVYKVGQLRPWLSKKGYWSSRKAGRRLQTKLYYARSWNRSEETLDHLPQSIGSAARYSYLKNQENIKFAQALPRHTLNYRLLFRRWHTRRDKFGTPIPRIWPSRAETKRRERMNYARFCRNLPPKKAPDPVFHELEVTTGFPSSLGYRRRRRTLQTKFNSNRWWKPRALLSPIYQTAGLVALRKAPRYVLEEDREKAHAVNSALTIIAHKTAFPSTPVSRKSFLPNRRAWDKDSWRLLGGFTLSEHTHKENWSLHKLSGVIRAAETACTTSVWGQCGDIIGVTAAAKLRTHFINQSQYWLLQRPYERTMQEKVLQAQTGLAAAKLKARISANRTQLFKRNPNWWQEEARRRLVSLESALTAVKMNQNSKESTTPLSHLRVAGALNAVASGDAIYARSSTEKTEKTMLAATLSGMTRAEKLEYFSDLISNVATNPAFSDRSLSAAYHLWLTSAESQLRKTRQLRSSQYQGEERRNTVTTTSLEKPRFPGIGRRKTSYDSAVRMFYRKTQGARFRRVQPLRFRSIRPKMHATAYSRQPQYETTTVSRQQCRNARKLSKMRYFTRNWRRVLNKGKLAERSAVAPSIEPKSFDDQVVSKRRRTSTPVELLTEKANNTKQLRREQAGRKGSAAAEQLLLAAVRARLKSRELKELKTNVTGRLTPVEQIMPPWQRANKKRIARSVRKANRHAFGKPQKYDKLKSFFWAPAGFEVAVPRDNSSREVGHTAAGEELLYPSAKFTREGWSHQGWTIMRGSKRRQRFCPQRPRRKNRFQQQNQKAAKKKSTKTLNKKKSRFFLRSHRRSATKLNRTVKRLVARKVLTQFSSAAFKFNYRLAQAPSALSSLTPIQFAKKNTQIVLSEKEKKRQQEGVRALKQEHYKETAQLSEMFTAFYPQLISLIVEKQFQGKQPAYNELKGAIRSIYWGLRMYLQSDSTGRRLAARDLNPAKFRALYNELVLYTQERYFDAAAVDEMRYRLQVHRLSPKQSFRPGALSWLRALFPKYYNLYLEDADTYRGLTLTTTETLRAHPSRKNPGQWRTNVVSGTMEQQFNRLTKLCGRQNTSRFENLLITTRRFPVTAGHGAANSMLVNKLPGLRTPAVSFFRRTYITRTFLHSTQERGLVSDRAALLRRSSSNESTPLANYAGASIRYSLKGRTYARERSSQAMTRNETGVGAIDPRLLRAKSPRNLQFMQRLGRGQRLTKTVQYKQRSEQLLNKKITAYKNTKGLSRSNRNAVTSLVAKSSVTNTATQRFRAEIAQRRLTNALVTRVKAHTLASPAQTQRRLFTGRKRAARTNKSNQAVENVKTQRSVLHHRLALHRTKVTAQAAAFILPRKSIFLKQTTAKLLSEDSIKTKILRKIYRKKLGRTNWFSKKMLMRDLKKLVPFRGQKTRLAFSPLRINLGRVLRRAATTGSFSSRQTVFSERLLKKSNKKSLHRTRRHFYSRLSVTRNNRKVISNFLLAKRDFALENPGALGRKELWKNITARWMKKHRILKNWLKFANLGLKEIDWYFMPPAIFKGVRSRLRKLEWREPDRHFHRPGWQNAFRFFPNEQRKAPWLEKLMYRRALFSTTRGAYRRYQFPREQKRLKWLQYYRKAVLPRRNRTYLKSRRWPRLRIYNQRLFRGLFSFRNKRAAQRHFQKLSKRKPTISGFSNALNGLGNRLDVNLVLLNIAPTIFWAKMMAPYGVFRVNGKIIKDPAFRLQENDCIHWNWNTIKRIKAHFQPALQKYEKARLHDTSATFPKNFEYYHGIATAIYKGLPKVDDLPKNSRLQAFLFRMFRADAISGK